MSSPARRTSQPSQGSHKMDRLSCGHHFGSPAESDLIALEVTSKSVIYTSFVLPSFTADKPQGIWYPHIAHHWTLIHRATLAPQVNPGGGQFQAEICPHLSPQKCPIQEISTQRGRNATRCLGDHVRIDPRGFFGGHHDSFGRMGCSRLGSLGTHQRGVLFGSFIQPVCDQRYRRDMWRRPEGAV